MLFKYFIVGLIQGLTEFLPVSSSGHILIFSNIFNVDCDIILLSVVAHLGTLFSVLFCMRKKVVELIKKPFCDTNLKLIIATIPAVVFVLFFKNYIDKLYGLKFVIYGFIITGLLLCVADFIKPKYSICKKRTALFMGLTQGFALLPGISRSGSTMAVGMLSGLKKEQACEFSFLMSIPIIIGSAVWEGIGAIGSTNQVFIGPLILAFVTSFIFGILSIKLMIKLVKNNKLYYFAIYVIFICIISLIFCKY